MNFITLRQSWDHVASVSVYSIYHRRGIKAFLQARIRDGDVVRCFPDDREHGIWMCTRKPRLLDYFRVPPKSFKEEAIQNE